MIVQQQHSQQKRRRSAFTLLEILVVVGIIVALAGMAIFYLGPQSDKTDRNLAIAKMKKIEQALDIFYTDHKQYPQQLTDLLQAVDGAPPIIKDQEAITDPWGTIFGYDPDAVDQQGVNRPKLYVQSPKGQGLSNY